MSEDQWNQDQAWAEESRWTRSDDQNHDWAEDVRTGAALNVSAQTANVPQSGLGIASLVLSIIAGLVMVVPLFFAAVLVAQNPNIADDDPQAVALGCGMIVGVLLAALAGILGLVGLFQPDRGKTCAILGTLFAGIEIIGMIGLIVLGLAMG